MKEGEGTTKRTQLDREIGVMAIRNEDTRSEVWPTISITDIRLCARMGATLSPEDASWLIEKLQSFLDGQATTTAKAASECDDSVRS